MTPIIATLVITAFVTILLDEFNVNQVTVQWLSTGFLPNRLSTRAVFMTAMSAFLIGTILCTIAPTFEMLMAGRVIQAVGTAMVLPIIVIAFKTGLVFIKNYNTPRKLKLDIFSVLLAAIGFGGFVTCQTRLERHGREPLLNLQAFAIPTFRKSLIVVLAVMVSMLGTVVVLPLWHSAPLTVSTMPTLFVGGTVILQREYHPVETMQLIGKERATAFFGPSIAFLAPLQVAAQAGSIGNYAMLGVDMRVVTADETDADRGETGEIWFNTDTRMKEYLHNPEATQEAFVGPWYRTGDIARVDEDGYLYIVDRLKDIIIVGDENVFSLKVEEAIAKHPRVADVAVVRKPDPTWGQQVAAVVTT